MSIGTHYHFLAPRRLADILLGRGSGGYPTRDAVDAEIIRETLLSQGRVIVTMSDYAAKAELAWFEAIEGA